MAWHVRPGAHASALCPRRLYKDEKKYNYANVRRWTLPQRLKQAGQLSGSVLDCELLVVPVHQGVHWVCAVVDLANKQLFYYDSLLVSLFSTKLLPAVKSLLLRLFPAGEVRVGSGLLRLPAGQILLLQFPAAEVGVGVGVGCCKAV